MNNTLLCLELSAKDWHNMQRQIEIAIQNYWHQHAGLWQPEAITLHVATRLFLDSADTTLADKQRRIHLPFLVAWLRQQSRVVTVLADPDLRNHRLYLNAVEIAKRSR